MKQAEWIAAALVMIAVPGVAQAQSKQDMKDAGRVASQPAKDVGAVKTKIPPVLEAAVKQPYAAGGQCTAMVDELDDLDEALGPDLVPGGRKGSKKLKVTGDAVAGLIVPFRGLVREVSGAAGAQRRLESAVDAGFARRGFLRGVYQTRGCKPAL